MLITIIDIKLLKASVPGTNPVPMFGDVVDVDVVAVEDEDDEDAVLVVVVVALFEDVAWLEFGDAPGGKLKPIVLNRLGALSLNCSIPDWICATADKAWGLAIKFWTSGFWSCCKNVGNIVCIWSWSWGLPANRGFEPIICRAISGFEESDWKYL